MSNLDPLSSESSDPITVGYSSNSLLSKKDPTVKNYKNTLLGTCINHTISGSTGQCNCTYPTTQANCFGYFVPSSVSLCGATGIEGHSGGCCMYDTENNTIIPCQQTTYCGCHALASKFNFEFKWTKFLSGQSCKDIDCVASVSELGACCNGKGLCAETTESVCAANKMFFQGIGTKCIMGEKSICIEGTGGCCDGSTLELGVPGASCIDSGKIFTGIQRNATEFYTEKNNLPCEYTAIPLTTLQFGDLAAGGMFIGIYTPGQSICYGRDLSSFSSLDNALDGSVKENVLYRSVYDWRGYGAEKNSLCDTEDSYAMILALDSMTIEHRDDVTGQVIETDTFTWSRGGPDWGPKTSVAGIIFETNDKELKNIPEGYYRSNSLDTASNLKQLSEYSCNNRSVGFDEYHSSNGLWSIDWGFNNTSRINSAELFRFSGITFGELSFTDYTNSSYDSTSTPMIEGVKEANRRFVLNSPDESHWFVPSLNELGYISFLCKYKNLNSILINSEGAPITGTHWSSTGSFFGQEGVFNGVTAQAGSVAWTMTFPNDISLAYNTEKSDRKEKHKVRLVKFIKCDGNQIPNINKKLPISL